MSSLVSADSDDVEIWIRDTGERLRFWTEYQYSNAFLTPTDKFVFKIGNSTFVDEYFQKLKGGTRISLVINGKTQCSGFVDSRNLTPSRNDGMVLTITGRDTLSPVVDTGVDPLYIFTTQSTLNDVFEKVIKPFVVYKIISTTDIANRSVMTGNLAANTRKLLSPSQIARYELKLGAKNSTDIQNEKVNPVVLSEYDPTKPAFLKDIHVDQVKPHEGEGCFEFLSRLSKRFRLWFWATALGDGIVVAAPDYAQRPTHSLIRTPTECNFLEGTYEDDISNQPSVIFATGIGAGGAKPYTKLKVAMINELTGLDTSGKPLPAVQKLINARKGFKVLDVRKELLPYRNTFASQVIKPMYLHDEESRTFGQLEGFVRHDMAQRQAEAFTLKYKVAGHTQNGIPWAVNTMVSIRDDKTKIYGQYWVKERTFAKSRQGTFTELNLIPPFTLML
jgi:prophage tail gpP-like protein